MDGYLLVDKPGGISSFGVVHKIRRQLSDLAGRRIKVGHTGTLDPAATGLLILVIGNYTKKAAEFSKLDKTYDCELFLGANSSTGDSEGKITQKSFKRPSRLDIETVLRSFKGRIKQTPPRYSAVKIGGQRAYKLARAGKEVEIEPRTVVIRSISGVRYDYPQLNFLTEVSSGTYIRSLAHDIGKELGTGAYLSKLRRTGVGKYSVEDAKAIDKITISDIISS